MIKHLAFGQVQFLSQCLIDPQIGLVGNDEIQSFWTYAVTLKDSEA